MRKFYIYFLGIVFCTVNFVNADLVSGQNSNWQVWYLGTAGYRGVDKYFVNGSTNLFIKANDASPISLYFGINANQDNNFQVSNNKNMYVGGNLYLDAKFQDDNSLQFGYLSSNNTKTAILNNRGYSTGFPSYSVYKLYEVNESNQGLVLFNGAYIENNNNLGFRYSKKLLNDNLTTEFSYIPNLKNGMTSNNNTFFNKIHKTLGALDASANYYNEYNDLGYGIIGAAREYEHNLAIKGGEILVTPNVDYLGFGFYTSLLMGKINNIGQNINYNVREFGINYSVLMLNFSGNYTVSNVHDKLVRDYTSNSYNFNINYNIQHNLQLNCAIFSNKLKHINKASGLALGFTIKM
ncbi:hypothetical protein ACFX5K_04750 [Rickettsiales bacterium LUAb2]